MPKKIFLFLAANKIIIIYFVYNFFNYFID